MSNKGLLSAKRGQEGFTLIELIVALAIIAMIASGVALMIYQMVSINTGSSNRILAVSQAQNVGYWITRDGEMAQDIYIGETENGFPLRLEWTDWDGISHRAVYNLYEETGVVIRDYYQKPVEVTEFSLEVSTQIAENIVADAAGTACYLEENGRLILNVTASVGGFMAVSESRQYEVIPRSSV